MSKALMIAILSLSVALAFVTGVGVGRATVDVPEQGVVNIGGQRVPIYGGAVLTIEFDEGETSIQPVILRDRAGRSKGGDLSTTIDSFASSFQMTAPELHMNGMGGTAGEVAYAAKGLAAKGHMVIIFAGVLCVVGGVVCMVYWNKKLGIYIAIAGGGLILVGVMLERFPWVALALPVIGVGIVVYFWLRARSGVRQAVTLKTIVAAVESAPETPAKVVKAAIKAKANGSSVVKAEVAKIKKELP